jgi:hypothetical protein
MEMEKTMTSTTNALPLKRPDKARLEEIRVAGDKYPWIGELLIEIDELQKEKMELAEIAVEQTKVALYAMERGGLQ